MFIRSFTVPGIFIISILGTLQVANAAPVWSSLGSNINGEIAVTNASGTLQAFARGNDNALWTNAQTSPDGPWGTWTSLGGVLSSDPAVGYDVTTGAIKVFVLGSDGALWTIAQSSYGSPFGSWQGLGGRFVNDPAVTTDPSGHIHLFVVGLDRALWTIAETSPGVFGGWISLGGVVLNNPAVVQNEAFCECPHMSPLIVGTIEVFVTGSDNTVWHNWSGDGISNWSGWYPLGGSIAGSPVVTRNLSGLVTVFGTGTDGALWYTAHPWGADWTPFASLGGSLTSDPSAALDAQGPIEVFVRGADNAVWYITGLPGAPWNFDNWATLGGILNNGPTPQLNTASGRLSVFVEGTDNAVWTIEQSSRGSWQ